MKTSAMSTQDIPRFTLSQSDRGFRPRSIRSATRSQAYGWWATGPTTLRRNRFQDRRYNRSSPLDALAAHWARYKEPSGAFPVGDVDLGVADLVIGSPTPDAGSLGKGRVRISFDEEKNDGSDFMVEIRNT